MIITCEKCNTRFNLNDKAINPAGSKVRCSVCSRIFTVYPASSAESSPQSDTTIGESEKSDRIDDKPHQKTTPVLEQQQDSKEPEDVSPMASGDDDMGADLDLSFSDFDLDIEEDEEERQETTETAVEDLDDDALMMEISGILDEAQKADASELDVSLDEYSAEAPKAVAANLDLDDLDLSLALEMDDGSEPSDIADNIAISDLDDGDLDLVLEMETEEGLKTADSGPELGEFSLELSEKDDGLSLDFDLDENSLQAVSSPSPSTELSDDLDLSGLDHLLDDAAENATTIILDGEDPELSLDLDDDVPLAVAAKTDDEMDMALDDLQLEMENKDDVLQQSSPSGDADDAEIDLSEIERMLEFPGSKSGSFSPSLDQELDLDIEASLETEKWMTSASKAETVIMDEEIDLSEFEEVLDAVDTTEKDQPTEEPELELDLGDTVASQTVAMDTDFDFDLSDFDGKATSGTSARDIEREAEKQHKPRPVETTLEDDDDLEATIAVPPQSSAIPVENAAKAAVSAGKKPKSGTDSTSEKSKTVKKGLAILLIVLALLAGAGGVCYFLAQKGVDIPIIGKYMEPKIADPGYLKLTTDHIRNRYVDNTSAGRLFVISGTVKNGYAENRGMITLQGKLFSNGKIIQQQIVCAGNIMSDLELANLEWNKIKERMENKLGDNQSNVKIEPGKTIPFMIVFSSLKIDPDEFTIEMTGSTALQ